MIPCEILQGLRKNEQDHTHTTRDKRYLFKLG